MPTQCQWYQSSHESHPIMGTVSSGLLHHGHIQTWWLETTWTTVLTIFIWAELPDWDESRGEDCIDSVAAAVLLELFGETLGRGESFCFLGIELLVGEILWSESKMWWSCYLNFRSSFLSWVWDLPFFLWLGLVSVRLEFKLLPWLVDWLLIFDLFRVEMILSSFELDSFELLFLRPGCCWLPLNRGLVWMGLNWLLLLEAWGLSECFRLAWSRSSERFIWLKLASLEDSVSAVSLLFALMILTFEEKCRL